MAVLLVFTALPATAGAAAPDRVVRASVSGTGGDPDGISRRPDISANGHLVAFESTASNLVADPNGPVSDVFLRDVATGRTALISEPPDGSGANGPSAAATIAHSGGIVVFESDATNLGPADANGATDIYARGGGPPFRVSLTSTGGEPDGRSFEPDVSGDGRFVVFTSTAANVVPGDTNDAEDVFVRDLVTNTTRRVSQGNGASRSPSISPDGRYVSFTSDSSDIVPQDTNEVADVFLADLRENTTRRVSVSSRGRQQNAAVVKPFFIVSDVSEFGRFVAFDSDATNLVAGDTNRDTDVFVRDVRAERTERVSRTALDGEADNDSYFPTISLDGRFVGFSSYAGNIWPGDRSGEDVFLHDRKLDSTTILTARESGAPVNELAKQLLRRPAIAINGRQVAFTSTSALVDGDGNQQEDVFVRNASAPQGRLRVGPARVSSNHRPRVRLTADDPRATAFLCRLDSRIFFCPRNGRLPRVDSGRHVLRIRAGGPGMRLDPTPIVRRFRVR